MLTLLKLELRKTSMNSYIIAVAIITLVMLAFTYLFAYAPNLEPNDPDLLFFLGYENVISLISILYMAIFCVLAAIMYAKYFLADYTGPHAILLFSYPIRREKIALAKIVIVYLFIIVTMMISSIFVLSIFSLTELVFPIVEGVLSFEIFWRSSTRMFILALLAAQIGVISVSIGFIKKSVPVTIVSALILISLFSNIMGIPLNENLLSVFAGFAAILCLFSIVWIMKKIKKMEV